jgi:cytochrome c
MFQVLSDKLTLMILGLIFIALAVAFDSSANAADMPPLAQSSGCIACHKIDTKLVGPAWMDVSKKYKGDAGARDRLIAKVKAGGKGNWTEVTGGVPMPPYSPRVSDENIGQLVDFVLGLAK